MLRDYQIEICERVKEAFARHRSVMVQMPTGTGKTLVLAELVNEELRMKSEQGGCAKVMIVAHRMELVEQIQQALLRVMGSFEEKSSEFFENHPQSPSLPLKKGLVTERFFYLTRPLLLGEAPHPLLHTPLLRRGGPQAWPAGPVRATKLSP